MKNIEYIYGKQIEFSRKTFGPGMRTKGISNHIRKELEEISYAPDDLIEWIDVMTLAFDGAWRCAKESYPDADATQLVHTVLTMYNSKQKENQKREWPDWRTSDPDGPIEHVRKD